MCLLQSSHTSSTASFYFCMNIHTPLFAQYFENSLLCMDFCTVSPCGKPLLRQGSTQMLLNWLIWMKEKLFVRHVRQAASEGQIHWAVSLVPLKLLYTSAQKLKNCGRKTKQCNSPHGDWQSPGAEEPAPVEVPPPAVHCWEDSMPQKPPSLLSMHFTCWTSPALKETFKLFRKLSNKHFFFLLQKSLRCLNFFF